MLVQGRDAVPVDDAVQVSELAVGFEVVVIVVCVTMATVAILMVLVATVSHGKRQSKHSYALWRHEHPQISVVTVVRRFAQVGTPLTRLLGQAKQMKLNPEARSCPRVIGVARRRPVAT